METVALVFRRIRIETPDLLCASITDELSYRQRPVPGSMRTVSRELVPKRDFRLFFAVEDEVSVEDFVAVVLAVRLSEHHQFNIGRIAV